MGGDLFGGRMWAKISFCFFVSAGRLDPGERDYTWQKITRVLGAPACTLRTPWRLAECADFCSVVPV